MTIRDNGSPRYLGSFRSEVEAKHAADLVLDHGPKAIDVIIDEWVQDIAEAIPADVRWRMFEATRDPIGESAERLGFCGLLTLRQVGLLYGVSKQRVGQIETLIFRKFRKPLAEFRDYEAIARQHALTAVEDRG